MRNLRCADGRIISIKVVALLLSSYAIRSLLNHSLRLRLRGTPRAAPFGYDRRSEAQRLGRGPEEAKPEARF